MEKIKEIINGLKTKFPLPTNYWYINRNQGIDEAIEVIDQELQGYIFPRISKKINKLEEGMKIKDKNYGYVGRITKVDFNFSKPYFVYYENTTFTWLGLEDIKSVFIEIEVDL